MPTVLSVTLAVGAQQLTKYKAIVTRITAIEELAAITVLYADNPGTLTTNKLTTDRKIIRMYGPLDRRRCQVGRLRFRMENQGTIDNYVIDSVPDSSRAHASIKVLDFKSFNLVDKRTECTYREESQPRHEGYDRHHCRDRTCLVLRDPSLLYLSLAPFPLSHPKYNCTAWGLLKPLSCPASLPGRCDFAPSGGYG